jgi:hypothetical protein
LCKGRGKKTKTRDEFFFGRRLMSSEMTELMKIVLYLLLSLGGGVLVAILGILLIILIGAVGAWLIHTLLRPGSGQIRL